MYKLVLRNCNEINIEDKKKQKVYLSVQNKKLVTTVDELTPEIINLVQNKSIYAVPTQKLSNQQNTLPPKQTKVDPQINNKWEEINTQKNEEKNKITQPIEENKETAQTKIEKPVEEPKKKNNKDVKQNNKLNEELI